MKVLILVLSALKDCYGEMLRVQQETWDRVEHPQTHTLYYCGNNHNFAGMPPNFNVGSWINNIFFSPKHDEELERVTARTLEAFEHSLNFEWDYMARTHSSTYVHKANLVDFCADLPADDVLCGLLTTGDAPFLWGGGGYILSRDVVERLVESKDLWNLGIMEDNALTNVATVLGIPFTPGRMASINQLQNGDNFVMQYGTGENFNFTDWPEIKRISPQYYVRCKQDLKRDQDLRIMRQLKVHYP